MFALAIKGLLNRQMMGERGTSELAFKVHRARVMDKKEVTLEAELIHAAMRIGGLSG